MAPRKMKCVEPSLPVLASVSCPVLVGEHVGKYFAADPGKPVQAVHPNPFQDGNPQQCFFGIVVRRSDLQQRSINEAHLPQPHLHVLIFKTS